MRTRALAALLLCCAACTDFDALSAGYGARDQAAPGDGLGGDDLSASGDLSGVDGGGPPPICDDGVLGPGETDIDCGGGCTPCDVGHACVADVDCQTGHCERARCELASGPPGWLPIGTAPTDPNTPPIPRNDLLLEQGPDGNLYAISGLQPDGSSTMDDVERLDQSNLTWSSSSKLNNKRSLAASASSGAGIFVLYGAKNSGFENSVERMATAPSWNTLGGLANNVSGPGAVIGGDGRVYLAGGFDGANTLKALRAFAVGDNNLTALADLTIARERLGLAVGSDGRIFAIGGRAAGATLASVEAYSIASNAWAPVAPLPEPRTATRAVLAPDGRIYLPGGADLAAGQVYRTVVAYRAGAAPLADRWSQISPLGGARYRHGVGVGVDGRVYVVAGSDLSGMLRTVEAYGPVIVPTPADKQAGQTISVSGINFAANATVRFSLGNASAAVIGQGTSDAAGVLPATTITIPLGTAAGATRLFATDSRSRYPVSTKFTVDP